MKEYIYLDMDLVNSYLAQIDEGILNKIIIGQSENDSHQEDGGEQKTHTVETSAGIGIISGKGQYQNTEIDKFSTVYSKNNSELIESALADYSVDVLLDRLRDRNLLKDKTVEWNDGDLVFSRDSFSIFNFDQLGGSVKKENIEKILGTNETIDAATVELDKLNKSPHTRVRNTDKISSLKKYLAENDPYHNFSLVQRFADYSAVLFPDAILLKVGNTLAMCSKKHVRINTPLLVFLSQTSRKINILGIVVTKREKSLAPEEGVKLAVETIASSAPAILTDIMLSSFNLIEDGDYFIRPLSIYFDQE